MRSGRKPWTLKLRPDMKHLVAPDQKGTGTILLPTPLLVAQEISAIPNGSIITVSTLRSRLAQRHGADATCPLMTGIFFNIIAGAAEEQLETGQEPLAPYWRVIRDDGSLSPKTPAGPVRQAEHLRAEGHVIESCRDKLRVADALLTKTRADSGGRKSA